MKKRPIIHPDPRCPADTILMPTVSAGHQNGVSIIRDLSALRTHRIKAIFYKFQFALMPKRFIIHPDPRYPALLSPTATGHHPDALLTPS